MHNFDEAELNSLGYQLLGNKNFKDAIHILRLNVEAYPQAGNVYDSLAEAYMDNGDRPLAIANYQKALQFDRAASVVPWIPHWDCDTANSVKP